MDTADRIKARKDHNCEWCPTRLAVGDVHDRWTYIDDGHWVHLRMHPDCHEAMRRSMEGALHDEPFCSDRHERGAECEH